LLAVLSTGIYAQVYRYRHTTSPIKREQLKWIVFGIAVGVFMGIGVNLFLSFFELANPSAGTYLIVDMVTQTLSVVAQFTVPVAVVFSILKYRLYDIELVINRSLVYGSLTIILAVVFGVILFSLQAAYRAVTDQTNPPTIAVVVATVAVSSIFQPARKVRRFVNRRMRHGWIRELKREESWNRLPICIECGDNVGGYKNLELIAAA
jgi:hypothetical protein